MQKRTSFARQKQNTLAKSKLLTAIDGRWLSTQVAQSEEKFFVVAVTQVMAWLLVYKESVQRCQTWCKEHKPCEQGKNNMILRVTCHHFSGGLQTTKSVTSCQTLGGGSVMVMEAITPESLGPMITLYCPKRGYESILQDTIPSSFPHILRW